MPGKRNVWELLLEVIRDNLQRLLKVESDQSFRTLARVRAEKITCLIDVLLVPAEKPKGFEDEFRDRIDEIVRLCKQVRDRLPEKSWARHRFAGLSTSVECEFAPYPD